MFCKYYKCGKTEKVDFYHKSHTYSNCCFLYLLTGSGGNGNDIAIYNAFHGVSEVDAHRASLIPAEDVADTDEYGLGTI